MKDKIKQHDVYSYLLIFISLVIGLKLFFGYVELPASFQKNSVDWYLNFSKEIFHPTYALKGAYFSESMLLPLLSNSLGAAKSMVAYKIFCSLLTISILPILSIFCIRYFSNIYQSTFLIFTVCISYSYLWDFNLGFPDPLTIVLLFMLSLEKNLKRVILWVSLAGLSHFSLALVSIVALLTMVIVSPSLDLKLRLNFAKHLVIGLIIGRLMLAIWYLAFDYHPLGRLVWILNEGLESFMGRYQNDPIGFWLMPGVRFLSMYGALTIIFLFLRKWAFVLASLITLGFAYGALFVTVDGYRIFAVAIAAPYIWLIKEFILSFTQLLADYTLKKKLKNQ